MTGPGDGIVSFFAAFWWVTWLPFYAVAILSVWLVRKWSNRSDLPAELQNRAFVQENLMDGESVMHVGRFHQINWQQRWVFYVSFSLLALLLSLAVAENLPGSRSRSLVSTMFMVLAFTIQPLPWLCLFGRCYSYNRMYKTEFVLTNKRLITKKGFFHLAVREIQLQKVESIDYGQIFLERWFNVGRLTVRGTGGAKIGKSTFLVDALEVRNQILEQINTASE